MCRSMLKRAQSNWSSRDGCRSRRPTSASGPCRSSMALFRCKTSSICALPCARGVENRNGELKCHDCVLCDVVALQRLEERDEIVLFVIAQADCEPLVVEVDDGSQIGPRSVVEIGRTRRQA